MDINKTLGRLQKEVNTLNCRLEKINEEITIINNGNNTGDENWQDTLDVSSVLNKNNVVNAANHSFNFINLTEYGFSANNSLLLVDADGLLRYENQNGAVALQEDGTFIQIGRFGATYITVQEVDANGRITQNGNDGTDTWELLTRDADGVQLQYVKGYMGDVLLADEIYSDGARVMSTSTLDPTNFEERFSIDGGADIVDIKFSSSTLYIGEEPEEFTVAYKVLVRDDVTGQIGYAEISDNIGPISVTGNYTLYSNTPLAGNGGFNNIFFGANAGEDVVEDSNTFIGQNTGQSSINASACIAIGPNALAISTNAVNDIAIGNGSGYGAEESEFAVFIGYSAGYGAIRATNAIFLGQSAGQNATDVENGIFIGEAAGVSASLASNSIFIGKNAGANDTVDNTGDGNFWSILIGNNIITEGFTRSIVLGSGVNPSKDDQLVIADTIEHIRLRGQEYELPDNDNNGVLTNTDGVLSWGAGGVSPDTIYTGDGSISGLRTVSGNDLGSIFWEDFNTFGIRDTDILSGNTFTFYHLQSGEHLFASINDDEDALLNRLHIGAGDIDGTYISFGNSLDEFVYLNTYGGGETVEGALGHGFRDNDGIMEYKNFSGSWTPISGGGGGTGGIDDVLAIEQAFTQNRSINTGGFDFFINPVYNLQFNIRQDTNIQMGDVDGLINSTVFSLSDNDQIITASAQNYEWLIAGGDFKITNDSSDEIVRFENSGYIRFAMGTGADVFEFNTEGSFQINRPDVATVLFIDNDGAFRLSVNNGVDATGYNVLEIDGGSGRFRVSTMNLDSSDNILRLTITDGDDIGDVRISDANLYLLEEPTEYAEDYKVLVRNDVTGQVGYATLSSLGAPGIDDVLALEQSLTTERTINANNNAFTFENVANFEVRVIDSFRVISDGASTNVLYVNNEGNFTIQGDINSDGSVVGTTFDIGNTGYLATYSMNLAGDEYIERLRIGANDDWVAASFSNISTFTVDALSDIKIGDVSNSSSNAGLRINSDTYQIALGYNPFGTITDVNGLYMNTDLGLYRLGGLGSGGSGTGIIINDTASTVEIYAPSGMYLGEPITEITDNIEILARDSDTGLIGRVTFPSNNKVTLTDGATITWDFTDGNTAFVTLGGNRTLAITGTPTNSYGVMYIKQDGAGSRTITLPAGSIQTNGWDGTLETGVNEWSMISFFYDGTNYYWDK